MPRLTQTLSLIVLLPALAASTATAAEQKSKSSYQPLRPLAECLDPMRARSFLLVDGDRLLVDAGRRHYLIELRWSCPSLYSASALDFRSRNPAGRICGDIEEQVSAAGSPALQLDRCRIAKVIRISRDEYRDEINGEGRRLSGQTGTRSPFLPEKRQHE